METTINNQTLQLDHSIAGKSEINLWTRILATADAQADNKTAWFLVSLIFQGVLFLPIPAALMYYYNAPIVVLPITFGLFLANIITGMGGSGIRIVLGTILLSVIINLAMLTAYVL